MPTDTERREAAERLKGYVSEWRDMPSFSVQKGVACSLGIVRFDVESQLLRLADLIYPDCEEGRYSVARTARPVDRDALLARRAERTCRNLNPPSCRDFECSECGESSEFTPGFMPNYCPNCGARVEEASDDADR